MGREPEACGFSSLFRNTPGLGISRLPPEGVGFPTTSLPELRKEDVRDGTQNFSFGSHLNLGQG